MGRPLNRPNLSQGDATLARSIDGMAPKVRAHLAFSGLSVPVSRARHSLSSEFTKGQGEGASNLAQ